MDIKLLIAAILLIALLIFSISLLLVFWKDRNFAFAMTFMQIALVIVVSTWGPHLVFKAEILFSDLHAKFDGKEVEGADYWASVSGMFVCAAFGYAAMKIRHAEYRLKALLDYQQFLKKVA